MTKRGGIKVYEGRVYARVRYGKNERLEVRLPWAAPTDEAAAEERAAIIAELCDELVAAGRRDLVKRTAKQAADATPARLPTVRKAIAKILVGLPKKSDDNALATFGDVAKAWTSGELRKKHPDHVRAKADFRIELGRLRRYIFPHVKDVPVAAFEKAHADLVMSKLPARRVKTSATRRHVAQIISRILNLAVHPLGLIKNSPLPKGFLPRIETRRHYTCLFPREEALVLGRRDIDEAFRLFVGVLDREGMRVSELADSEWWQWNLIEGTFTATKNKSKDPRMWALRPDVARAMRIWHDRHGKTKARPFIDVVPDKKAKLYLATRLREAISTAGITRTELLESTEFTGKMRAHDLRATFVTVSLAEGKPETWIRDRTAHKTLGMIDRYRRTARQFGELRVGSLVDLVEVLGWGISRVILATGTGGGPTLSSEESGSSGAGIRTPIRGSKIRARPSDRARSSAIVEGNASDDTASQGGITHGSPTLAKVVDGLALERTRWAALDSFAAALASEEASA